MYGFKNAGPGAYRTFTAGLPAPFGRVLSNFPPLPGILPPSKRLTLRCCRTARLFQEAAAQGTIALCQSRRLVRHGSVGRKHDADK